MRRRKQKPRRSSQALSERDFASMMAALIHGAGEPSRPVFRAEDFSLVGAADKVFRLGNIYEEFRQAPPRRRSDLLTAATRTWFRVEQRVPSSFEDARSDLRPVIRRRGDHECHLLEQQAGEKAYFTRRVIAGHYAMGVAFDWPECMAHVNDEQLTAWGVGLDDALDVAIENLRAISREGLREVAPGLWGSPWHDNYDPARILLPDLIRRCEVAGAHVAMLPNRDSLIVTGADDVGGLERMASLAEEASSGPRFLSGIPLLAAGDGWIPFELPGSHPLARRYRLLWHQTMAADYGRQGPLLAASYALTGADHFAAGVFSRPGSDTFACWSEGIVTLLPETMYVAFQSPDLDRSCVAFHGFGAWDRVREISGDLMEPLGLYPERYLVRSFPNPEQLEAILGSGETFLAELERGRRA